MKEKIEIIKDVRRIIAKHFGSLAISKEIADYITELPSPEVWCRCEKPINYEVNNWCHKCNRPIKDWKEPIRPSKAIEPLYFTVKTDREGLLQLREKLNEVIKRVNETL